MSGPMHHDDDPSCECMECDPNCARYRARLDAARDTEQRFHRDAGKPRWSLIPTRAMRSILAVLEFGAKKYAARSYLTVPNARERYLESLYRHIEAVKEAVQDGGIAALLAPDAESGMPHLAHAGCDVIILLDLAAQAWETPHAP